VAGKRPLEKCIEYAVVVAEGTQIGPEHLPAEIHESLRAADVNGRIRDSQGATLPEAVRRLERELITDALDECGGVKTLAADRLGIHESTLRKKMKVLGISGSKDPEEVPADSGSDKALGSRTNVRIV
jgi:DNA-binding NtrC family response regulator